MKVLPTLLLSILGFFVNAQTALYNNGNLQIHSGGNLGFHTNFINDAPTDQNLGLVGFYGPRALTVSGTVTPLFFDTEIAAEANVLLQLGYDNTNSTNFILGDFVTPLNLPDIYYNFMGDSFYGGENDLSKINGYAAITNQKDFMFPVGDSEFLRPLRLTSEDSNLFAKCAYFLENANNPLSLPNDYPTSQVDIDVEAVSTREFWKLEGTVPATITINWNTRSALANLTNDATLIIPVGWSKISNRWLSLGVTSTIGSLEQGIVTSESFVPDDYEIITFGVSRLPLEPTAVDVLTLDNYLVTANNDGINDALIIPELAGYPENLVQVYDRYGIKVFEKENYTDEFKGFSNQNNVIFSKEKGLPVGVYFYTVDLPRENLYFQGFLYLAR